MPLLVPLARALGVTVDDLLDGEKPIRTLTRADGQSLLSFAFALGGGVLFFLLDLFMPALLCYLAYLGCMAYGVYLQRYYCYQNRWFRIGNAAMDLSVNLTVVLRLGTGLAALPAAMTIANVQEWRVRLLFWWKDHLPLLLLLGVLLALALTALTLWLVERCGFGRRPVLLRPGLRRPAVRELLPALSLLLLTAFWLLFRLDALPLEAYLRQSLLYGGLAGMLILLCLPFFRCRQFRIASGQRKYRSADHETDCRHYRRPIGKFPETYRSSSFPEIRFHHSFLLQDLKSFSDKTHRFRRKNTNFLPPCQRKNFYLP